MPDEHGVIANGFYWRDKHEIEMWTAWNDCIRRPQIWDRLHERDPGITSAVWFPLHSKGCGADYICTPAPIHNPDGTRIAVVLHQANRAVRRAARRAGAFSAATLLGADRQHQIERLDRRFGRRTPLVPWQPDFFYIYLPHLDYAAQKNGPDSPEAAAARHGDWTKCLGRLFSGFREAYGDPEPLWLVASEYAIVPVDHVTYPNRVLREAGLLSGRRRATTASISTWPAARPGPWSIISRRTSLSAIAIRKPLAGSSSCSAAKRGSPRCCCERREGQLRIESRAGRRSRARFHAE